MSVSVKSYCMNEAAFFLKRLMVLGLMTASEASRIFRCRLAMSGFLLSGMLKSETSAIMVFAQKLNNAPRSQRLSVSLATNT